jgi:hypothetical protein
MALDAETVEKVRESVWQAFPEEIQKLPRTTPEYYNISTLDCHLRHLSNRSKVPFDSIFDFLINKLNDTHNYSITCCMTCLRKFANRLLVPFNCGIGVDGSLVRIPGKIRLAFLVERDMELKPGETISQVEDRIMLEIGALGYDIWRRDADSDPE